MILKLKKMNDNNNKNYTIRIFIITIRRLRIG